ncbi:MAG: hypothetical protein C7B43_07725 [Sulfobacillus benefaciens]|uniref:Uncharacterized protein n=1 Tax=Sulfobacillus benefaciens TaxID=453960 RepID=A0A2T2X592_9FIRM|nr:MAG: hypothetical protein C7B43_07725 [Sulfobacillus benefaciens]HBQ96773.1 hypothetical protein [Sulfobacillus sp.]
MGPGKLIACVLDSGVCPAAAATPTAVTAPKARDFFRCEIHKNPCGNLPLCAILARHKQEISLQMAKR